MPSSNQIDYSDFEKVDVRLGKITEVKLIEGAKHSTHRLVIDFGEEIGQKVSCARLVNYEPADLVGKQILGVVNFPPRQIGQHMSETLTLGIPDGKGETNIITVDEKSPLGGKLY